MNRRHVLRKTNNKKLHQIHDLMLAKIELIECEKDDEKIRYQWSASWKAKNTTANSNRWMLLDRKCSRTMQTDLGLFQRAFIQERWALLQVTYLRAMKKRFTRNEISQAIVKLWNNRSSGLDNSTAELLKYRPFYVMISALIYNCLSEITQGLLCAQ